MTFLTDNWMQVAVALGIGLLIGVERERRKGGGRDRAPAGIRTYAVTALLGAIGFELGGIPLLAVVTVSVAGFIALGYFRTRSQRDPGLTSEFVQLLTLLLGALAMREPLLASSLGVTVALLLAARTRIHIFVRKTLTEAELHDALVLAGAALVVLPLMPDRYMGPFNAINPHTLWIIVVLMMAISAGGYIALRLFGPRYGLPAAGLASGFVSSSATVASMGTLAKQKPELMPAAVGGAVLSTVATIVQMVVVLGVTHPATLAAMAMPLILAGLMAVGYGAWFFGKALRQKAPETIEMGRAFSFRSVLILASTMGAVLLIAAALNTWLGSAGLIAGTAIAGFADTHSPAVSVASLAAGGKLKPAETLLPILLAMSANTITKMVLGASNGGGRFASQVIPGLLLTISAGWLGGLQILMN